MLVRLGRRIEDSLKLNDEKIDTNAFARTTSSFLSCFKDHIEQVKIPLY